LLPKRYEIVAEALPGSCRLVIGVSYSVCIRSGRPGTRTRGEAGMRRTAMVLIVVALMVALCASVAVAASFDGTDRRDVISGRGEDDVISGLGGDDTLNGFGGEDTVKGGEGGDEVSGGSGADKAYGNAGDDYLIDAPDEDRDILYGGPGRDNVQVRDFPAVKDEVYCGSGRDTAYVDRLDVVHDCEIVRLP
jgi:hemolysin type calcium-binding protein